MTYYESNSTTFVVLLALAAVAVASPVGKENVQQESLVDNEADLAKIKGSAGIKCRGKKCEVHVGIGGSWYVADDGTLVPVLEAEPAGGHVDVECHGKRCSGNIGVGVDWFKDEDGNVSPVIVPIPRPTEEDSVTGDNYRYRGGKIPTVPIIPKDMPRLIKPKSYNAEEEDKEPAYVQKDVVLGNGNEPVEMVFDSDCNEAEADDMRCNDVTLGIQWYKLPSGEIVSQFTEDENTSIEQVGPTTARVKWNGKGRVVCRKRKCHVEISGGVHNRRRRDLGNDAVEINKTFLTLKEKDLPLDMVLHFARYD
ncbi:hypothetical protein V1478_004901 [Vespula squamosa]|uniref:Uncharacterized protein n=1 Tax=Vespula squamosa TaxID=30214 RepID=A0ABD2BF19_VESSQ